jgi:hypothetical protein
MKSKIWNFELISLSTLFLVKISALRSSTLLKEKIRYLTLRLLQLRLLVSGGEIRVENSVQPRWKRTKRAFMKA